MSHVANVLQKGRPRMRRRRYIRIHSTPSFSSTPVRLNLPCQHLPTNFYCGGLWRSFRPLSPLPLISFQIAATSTNTNPGGPVCQNRYPSQYSGPCRGANNRFPAPAGLYACSKGVGEAGRCAGRRRYPRIYTRPYPTSPLLPASASGDPIFHCGASSRGFNATPTSGSFSKLPPRVLSGR